MLHLVGYIWIWLFLAFGLGMLISYALWGGAASPTPTVATSHPPILIEDRGMSEASEDAERTIRELQKLMERLREELAGARRERESSQHQLKEALAQLEATKYQKAERELELERVKANLLHFSPPDSAPMVSPTGESALTPDDLTEINGIGPFIASKLHNVGISTFRALAEITPEQQAVLARQIEHFNGRITQENWVAQAQALHEKKVTG